MPDTGAPWNIPYVEAADLVSDWPADSLALANAIDAGLDAASNAGIGSNVVSAVKTDTFSTTSENVDVPGLSISFTPTSATSKVLVIVTLGAFDASQSARIYGRVYRDATILTANRFAFQRITQESNRSGSVAWHYLDSPATTSAVTYKVTIGQSGGTTYVNTNSGSNEISSSSITAIEVAA